MAAADAASSSETPADFGTDAGGVAQRWISEITLAERDQEAWKTRARAIIRLYRADQKDGSADVRQRRFSLLWSNIETLAPAVYARTPTAVVGRRYKDDDPVGRLASEVLERALNFALDAVDFTDIMLGVRNEYLLVARGQAWVRYVPHMQTVTPPAPAGDDDVEQPSDGEAAEGAEPYEVVAWEEAVPDHVTWDDFLHNVARKWSEVRWVARVVYMMRDELIERFGEEIGGQVPLDHGPDSGSGASSDDKDQFKKAAVYEIWDKPSRKAIWVSKAYTEAVLDERDDPLGLQDFFPCPRPLLGTCGPDSLIPTPDYVYYQTQAKDIDELTVRIGLLLDALKMRGFYAAGDSTGKSLADLMTSETGTLIPVDSWAAFSEKGGVQGLIAWVPLDMVGATLKGCIDARQQLIEDVYQLTGISDVMRGDNDPAETATATQTKATWGSSRVRDKQKELARFARDILRIMGQVIASKFSAETLSAMTNVQLLPSAAAKAQLQQQLQLQAQQAQMLAAHAQQTGQPPPPPFQPPPDLLAQLARPTWEDVQALLKDSTLRSFRIDVETDSTIEPDDQDEKQRRIEFIQAVGEYVSKSIPAIQLVPAMAPVIAEGLKFLVRGFRVGREMEDVIDRALDQLTSSLPPPQPPSSKGGADPQAEQARGQAAMISAHAKLQDAQTRQFAAQTDRGRAIADAQTDQARIQAESQRTAADRAAAPNTKGGGMHADDLRADLQQAVIEGTQRRAIQAMNPEIPIQAPTP